VGTQTKQNIKTLSMLGLSLCFSAYNATYVGLSAGLRFLVKNGTVKYGKRDIKGIMEHLNKKGISTISPEELQWVIWSVDVRNALRQLDGNPDLASIEEKINNKDTINAIVTKITDNNTFFNLIDTAKDCSEDGDLSFGERFGLGLGAKVLFDLSTDGFYKLGVNVGMHLLGGKTLIGDKDKNFMCIQNPFGFSVGPMVSIGWFRASVELAIERLVADYKPSTPDILKADKSIAETKDAQEKIKKVTEGDNGITKADEGRSQSDYDLATDYAKKLDARSSILNETRTAEGISFGLNLRFGAAFDVIRDTLKMYADVVLNMPISGVKGKDNSLFASDKLKRGFSTAIEVGMELSL
jgi:hypothetical protein